MLSLDWGCLREPLALRIDEKTLWLWGWIMKLRVRDQSVRFRLSPEDVAALGRGESVIAVLRLGPDLHISYGLRVCSEEVISVEQVQSGVIIECPRGSIERLAHTEEVGFERVIKLAGGDSLSVLVEKDFQCLIPRGEDDGTTFPNPNAKS